VLAMVYKCAQCNFLFERISSPEKCPDCGKSCVVEADEKERAEFKQNRNTFCDEKMA